MWKCVDLINKAVDKIIDTKTNCIKEELKQFINDKFEEHEEHERNIAKIIRGELTKSDDLRTRAITKLPPH